MSLLYTHCHNRDKLISNHRPVTLLLLTGASSSSSSSSGISVPSRARTPELSALLTAVPCSLAFRCCFPLLRSQTGLCVVHAQVAPIELSHENMHPQLTEKKLGSHFSCPLVSAQPIRGVSYARLTNTSPQFAWSSSKPLMLVMQTDGRAGRERAIRRRTI